MSESQTPMTPCDMHDEDAADDAADDAGMRCGLCRIPFDGEIKELAVELAADGYFYCGECTAWWKATWGDAACQKRRLEKVDDPEEPPKKWREVAGGKWRLEWD